MIVIVLYIFSMALLYYSVLSAHLIEQFPLLQPHERAFLWGVILYVGVKLALSLHVVLIQLI